MLTFKETSGLKDGLYLYVYQDQAHLNKQKCLFLDFGLVIGSLISRAWLSLNGCLEISSVLSIVEYIDRFLLVTSFGTMGG